MFSGQAQVGQNSEW